MDPDYTAMLELLSRRLALMRELAKALEQGQETLVRLDLKAIQHCTTRQQEICDELAVVSEPLKAEHQRLAAMNKPAMAVWGELKQSHSVLVDECVAIERRVCHLNLVYAALLRKTRQSFAVLNNLISAAGLTYAPPEPGGSVKDACAIRE